MTVNIQSIKSKEYKYSNAKYNINQAIIQLENIKMVLNNKNNFESARINAILKDLDDCINDLRSKKDKISSSINCLNSEIRLSAIDVESDSQQSDM